MADRNLLAFQIVLRVDVGLLPFLPPSVVLAQR